MYHFLITAHHPSTAMNEKHIFSECIVERNAIELGVFLSCASPFCVRAKEVYCVGRHPEKRGEPVAGASAAPEPLKRPEWRSAIGSSQPELRDNATVNFEDEQQLKTRLHYINYAFMLLSCSFWVATSFQIQRGEWKYSEHANNSANAAVGDSLRGKCGWVWIL